MTDTLKLRNKQRMDGKCMPSTMKKTHDDNDEEELKNTKRGWKKQEEEKTMIMMINISKLLTSSMVKLTRSQS